MADPISLLGLVAGIVTFVDFGLKIISGSKSVRRSLDGMAPETADFERSIKHVQALNNSIMAQRREGQQLSENEVEVVAMVQESEKLFTRLKCSLDKLKVRPGAHSKTLEAGRVTLRSLWSHSDLMELGKRLAMLDQRIRISIQTILEVDHHTSVMSKLKAVQSTQIEYGINHEAQFDRIRKDILELTIIRQQSHEIEIATQAASLESLNTKLEYLLGEFKVSSYYNQVIQSLHFSEVHRRFEQVPYADKKSNDWIYEPRLTPYVVWLESMAQNDSIFYIQGKAGSGKSTLMKYISEHQHTHEHLKNWAGEWPLHTASYFFWNQGSEMQKSRLGLMQSLLYQILSSAPHLIPPGLKNRLHHENWRLRDLLAVFNHIADHKEVRLKYCFFIDGLDEYNGDDSDIVPMLQALSNSPHIKICASSRPGRVYERTLHRKNRNFDIAQFTREAMRNHVQAKLSRSQKFLQLARYEPECATIISNISQYANGVWLWVWLVTRDILFEVERDEGVGTLRKIVDEFPADLEQYFKRIIDRVNNRHKEEMAQIFLVTAHELRPLPLYAFTVLERERRDPGYTISAPIQGLSDAILKPYYPEWRARIQNRCSDLLVVDRNLHPQFLTHTVGFLHRTVREFMRDCYQTELQDYLRDSFNPFIALCNICFALLKTAHVDDFTDRATKNYIMGLTNELLYYARETEDACSVEDESALEVILDNLDAVNKHHAGLDARIHWTNEREPPTVNLQRLSLYRENGHCNFLALAVQARLVKYVRTKLESEPRRLQKPGRPLLDYALRPLRSTPVVTPYHLVRDDSDVSVDMVRLLLSHGADPNEVVHHLDQEPVWALFLVSIHETTAACETTSGVQWSLKRAWYQCCETLIEAGARFDHVPAAIAGQQRFTVQYFLWRVFSPSEAARLTRRIQEKAQERSQSGLSCSVM